MAILLDRFTTGLGAIFPTVEKRNPKMTHYKLGQQYSEPNEVKMNEYDFSKGPILLYTDGLGPCIGVCIAWQAWAGIAHLGSQDEHDELPKFIAKAKEFLPQNVVPNIRPIICGADP